MVATSVKRGRPGQVPKEQRAAAPACQGGRLPGAGRPRRGHEHGGTPNVTVRLPRELHRLAEAAAAQRGVLLSEWIRAAMIAALEHR